MIETDLEFLKTELEEELKFFPNFSDLKVKHRFLESENKVVNTMTVNGKTYAYGNLVDFKGKSDIEKKRLIKRYAKLSLYKAVSAFTEIKLPWGALTGVRPTKLAYSTIEEAGDFEEFFLDTMKVSEEKMQLVKEVIENQKGIYEKNSKNTDFFVFIPFCPSRCKYCSFITSAIDNSLELVDNYVDTLVYEINESASLIKNLRSIYIGGGTPVAIPNKSLDKILCAIDKINSGVEFTVEAGRPDVITKENLAILRAHGVNRVCVNPQTLSNETLKRIGRNHTESDFYNAYNLARPYFDINVDLIAGLDGEDFDAFKSTIDKVKDISPDNITVHSLCVKKGSYLAENDYVFNKDTEKMIDYARAILKNSGYSAYYVYRQKYASGNLENVGYTRIGKSCIYNIDSMEEISSCVACGANGISKLVNFEDEKIERYASPKDVKTYLAKIEEIIKEKAKLFENL